MLAGIPLMIIPLLIYNGIIIGIGGASVATFQNSLFELPMMSGAIWRMSVGEVLIAGSLLVLFAEMLKATLVGRWLLADHIASTVVFIIFLVEFLLVADAATSVFFILMAIALVDVVAGFSISIRSAGRDVSIGL